MKFAACENMSVDQIFTFTAPTANSYCETQVDSPVATKDLRPSQKRKASQPDPGFSDKLKFTPRRETMPEYDHEERQQRKLRYIQSRQTRSQTIANRLEAERVQQELDAYLDHIKSLALVIEREQQSRQSQILLAQKSLERSPARSKPSRNHRRVRSSSISSHTELEEHDADNEGESHGKWKGRVHQGRAETRHNILDPQLFASE